MNIKVTDILQGATLLVVVGMWVGGINAMGNRIDSMEKQLLVWLDDAEKTSEVNHVEVMAAFGKQQEKISRVELFLSTKYPEYTPYDSTRIMY